jgi:hypothetical protein
MTGHNEASFERMGAIGATKPRLPDLPCQNLKCAPRTHWRGAL